MGETAARLLLERIEGRRDRAVVMASTPHLIPRGSSGPTTPLTASRADESFQT
jgi:LacI family transcriptional regulator